MIDVFIKFKAMVERQSGHKIKIMRTYGDGKYVSKDFDILCASELIVHDVVSPYTPQSNGTAERKNITIRNMVISVLKGKHLPNEVWVKLCRLQHTH